MFSALNDVDWNKDGVVISYSNLIIQPDVLGLAPRRRSTVKYFENMKRYVLDKAEALQQTEPRYSP